MKCSDCPKSSNYICPCSNIFLCNSHIGEHHDRCNRSFEKLVVMSINESKVLKQKIISQILALKTAKSKIQNETKKLIIEAEYYAESTKIVIKRFEVNLYRILNLKFFYNIQKKEIEEITMRSVNLQNLDLNISKHIKDSFQNILENLPVFYVPFEYLPVEIIPSNNWKIEQKNNYAKKIIFCLNVIPDHILFSNDGNLCFYCKI